MAWKESDLLTDLATIYFAVSPAPQIKDVQDDKGVTWMTVSVLEVGKSEKDKKAIAYRKSVDYYVFHRGLSDEAAFYFSDQPVNTSLKDVTIATSSYQTIAYLYNSSILRNRVMSAIMTQCSSVFLEGSGATNHANRMKLVNLANVNLPLVVSQFMSAIALNATIQAAGTACTDANILSVISGAWDSYASLIIA